MNIDELFDDAYAMIIPSEDEFKNIKSKIHFSEDIEPIPISMICEIYLMRYNTLIFTLRGRQLCR